MSNTRIELLKKVDVSKPKADKNYQQMIVTHTDLVNGKTDGKKLFDFTAKAVWGTLLTANPGDVFEVERNKNDKGYWEWTGIKPSIKTDTDAPAQAVTSSTRPAASAAPSKSERVGSWETPEERAVKQIYIVRQSNINSALEYAKHNRVGKEITADYVLNVAKVFEDYVFDSARPEVNDQPE